MHIHGYPTRLPHEGSPFFMGDWHDVERGEGDVDGRQGLSEVLMAEGRVREAPARGKCLSVRDYRCVGEEEEGGGNVEELACRSTVKGV